MFDKDKKIKSLSPMSNDDLLTEILIRLPIKSLGRFKSVSKHWLSLISEPELLRRRSSSASGLLLTCFHASFKDRREYAAVGITSAAVPAFRKFGLRSRIEQSCNGLLLCSITSGFRVVYYVYNPTTRRHTALPKPDDGDRMHGVALAFDPSESPLYRVVCVTNSAVSVYSSDSSLWRSTQASLTGEASLAVYCNGSVHWMGSSGRFAPYFNFATEEVRHLPMPGLTPRDPKKKLDFCYFGASRDHLHAVEPVCESGASHFSVLEFEKDYSKWVVKYRVDISEIQRAFPEMTTSRRKGMRENQVSVLCVVRCEEEEESFMVMNVPMKIVGYNFKTGSLYKLADAGHPFNLHPYSWSVVEELVLEPCFAYQYVESLASV